MFNIILLIPLLLFSGCSLRDAYQDQKSQKHNELITGKIEHNKSIEYSILHYTVDAVADLNSSIFAPDKGHDGMWTPVAFLKHNTPGIYFTQPPIKGKKLVLFIHGINGTPANFSTLINAVDRTKFQPCFAFYPSGARLSIISQYIVQWVNALQIKYDYNDIVIVAHSMGGLVAKATLDELARNHQQSAKSINPKGLITYATPWGGFPIANRLENFPVVLESWRDLASGSPFLQKLYATPIPSTVPFILVFSYDNRDKETSGDGTVPHSSQLYLPIQTQAVKLIGVNANHDDVLLNELSLKTLSQFLETSQQKNTLQHKKSDKTAL